jgi:hypothetical protein
MSFMQQENFQEMHLMILVAVYSEFIDTKYKNKRK